MGNTKDIPLRFLERLALLHNFHWPYTQFPNKSFTGAGTKTECDYYNIPTHRSNFDPSPLDIFPNITICMRCDGTGHHSQPKTSTMPKQCASCEGKGFFIIEFIHGTIVKG